MKKRVSLLCIPAIVAGLLLPAVAQATVLYALKHYTNGLFKIDTATLTLTAVGLTGVTPAPGGGFPGLAYDPYTATLYMAGGRMDNNLYALNQQTGAATLVGNHGMESLFGLAFDSRGNVLYGASQGIFGTGPDNLVALNTVSGAATVVGDMGRAIDGLAYDSKRDELVGIEPGAGDLYAINRNSAIVSLLYDGEFVDNSGLTYDVTEDLYWGIDFRGNLFSHDPNKGYARTIHLTGLAEFTGLTAVVPEPETLFLLVFGIAGLVFARRATAPGWHRGHAVLASGHSRSSV
ncbi:MAG: hypothetical protein Hals2KO_35830 [Halioglobus sp.]